MRLYELKFQNVSQKLQKFPNFFYVIFPRQTSIANVDINVNGNRVNNKYTTDLKKKDLLRSFFHSKRIFNYTFVSFHVDINLHSDQVLSYANDV